MHLGLCESSCYVFRLSLGIMPCDRGLSATPLSCHTMPSLHQLWKTLHSQTDTQNRLRATFNTKLYFSYTLGEISSHFEFPGLFRKISEVADPGKPLSIPQAASRVFATPSVHGPVWQSFSYHPCQALLDRNQTARSKQTQRWTITSSHYTITKGKHLKLEATLHVWSLDIPPESSISTLGFTKQWGYQRNVQLWEKKMQKLGLNYVRPMDFPRLGWTCYLEDAGQNKEAFYNGQEIHENSQLWQLLSTSAAFHFLQFRPCLLQVVWELFQRAAYGFTCGGTAAIMQFGLTFHCTADNKSVEVREKHRERSLSSTGLRLLSAACCLPHPEKQDTGGEDAYFICPDKQVIGVADGVGGWADVGVDAGEYARQLMNQSLIAAQQEPAGCIDTAHVMEIAHSKTTCRGSSTACILALSDYGLQAANLGDSGFLVVRNGRKIFKSPTQQHNFNVPFQLESGGGDPPDAAKVFTVEVAVGDVIVAGTDGVFDNLYDTELVTIVVQATRSGLSPDITAQKIAFLAKERARDCNRQTPFSAAAQDAGLRFYGGKMDDITVIVSYVVK